MFKFASGLVVGLVIAPVVVPVAVKKFNYTINAKEIERFLNGRR